MNPPRRVPARKKGQMPLGNPMTIRRVKAVERDGDRYTVHYWGGYWETWRINAFEARRLPETHMTLMPPDRGTIDLVDAWAYRTHRAMANETATHGLPPDVA